jgi:hypothetical protein
MIRVQRSTVVAQPLAQRQRLVSVRQTVLTVRQTVLRVRQMVLTVRSMAMTSPARSRCSPVGWQRSATHRKNRSVLPAGA